MSLIFARLCCFHFNRNLHLKQVTFFQNFPNFDIFQAFFALLRLLHATSYTVIKCPSLGIPLPFITLHSKHICFQAPYLSLSTSLIPSLFFSLSRSLSLPLSLSLVRHVNPLNRPKPNRIQTNSALVSHFAFRFGVFRLFSLSRYAVFCSACLTVFYVQFCICCPAVRRFLIDRTCASCQLPDDRVDFRHEKASP